MGRTMAYLREVIAKLCDNPNHLQRLAIIGAGICALPMVILGIMIVWHGGWSVLLAKAALSTNAALLAAQLTVVTQQLNILGNALLGMLAIWAIVVLALLGTVRSMKVQGPGGLGVDIETTATTTIVPTKETQ